ncbi:OmpA family protein [Phaeobacter sp. QD34_3]|uniref:OmpA family protein n=1 Tax=unclassified Phaeobacter TaxID=2621772 RepID=UPI00237F3321|nr:MULTISPECIES: OmpA family protein [unclassified Phaeobacter]MDE4132658.1 OmpA family protein [Phaeobacter sp. QD34_3]MDE4136294.1 OmpA family protein [Phaeobacter sp. QD34_24]
MTILKISTVAAVSLVLGLGACTDPAMLNRDGSPSKERQGLIAGGILGAGIGALSGASNKTAAVIGGAAAGALAGGLIGSQLDKQEAELRQSIANDRIAIVNTGDRLILLLPDDLTFATDSSDLTPSIRADLLKVADSLVRYPNSTVQVIGHTDSDGDAAYNQGLSERRASVVADQIQAGGVPYNRIRTIGRGEAEPVASNLTEEGKAQNRRVEIVIIPQ